VSFSQGLEKTSGLIDAGAKLALKAIGGGAGKAVSGLARLSGGYVNLGANTLDMVQKTKGYSQQMASAAQRSWAPS
jgi:hypothetical protein